MPRINEINTLIKQILKKAGDCQHLKLSFFVQTCDLEAEDDSNKGVNTFVYNNS